VRLPTFIPVAWSKAAAVLPGSCKKTIAVMSPNTGTQTGDLLGIPASGPPLRWEAVDAYQREARDFHE
jgi:hypothetical protein